MHHLGWSHHHVKESSCQPWHPAWVSKVHATWEYMGADNVFGKPACWVIMSGSYYHLLRGEDLLCGGEHLQLYHNFPSNQPPFPTRQPFQQFIANSSEQLFCIIFQIRERLHVQLTSQHKQPESLLSESYRTFSTSPWSTREKGRLRPQGPVASDLNVSNRKPAPRGFSQNNMDSIEPC